MRCLFDTNKCLGFATICCLLFGLSTLGHAKEVTSAALMPDNPPPSCFPKTVYLYTDLEEDCAGNKILHAGEQICLEFWATDSPVDLTFDLSNMPGASVNSLPSNSIHVKREVCWTPSDDDIGEVCISVSANYPNNPECNATYDFCFTVVCDYCDVNVEYEKRSIPLGNRLPAKTEASGFIEAGYDVGAPTPNGVVEVVAHETVLFESSCEITLMDGFAAYNQSDFIARIEQHSCTPVDCDCCLGWNGFSSSIDFDNLVNSDDNYIWQAVDYDNPDCPFGATSYRLIVKDTRYVPAKIVIDYTEPERENECCPFISPEDIDDNTISSISYDFSQLSAAQYEVTLELFGCDGASTTITENVQKSTAEPLTLSTEETRTSGLSHISVYPNPSQDYLNIEAENINVKRFEITGLDGRSIHSGNLKDDLRIDISILASGRYMLRLEAEGQIKVLQFEKI